MSGTKTRMFVFLAALVFCMATLLVGAYADVADVQPSVNPVINYPAYPLRGGPYIVATTFNPDMGGTPVIVLVFNEDIDDASLSPVGPEEDFESATFDLTQCSYGVDPVANDNVVWLTFAGGDPSNAVFDGAAIEVIAMLAGQLEDHGPDGVPDGVPATGDEIPNMDVTELTIGTGPVITNVVVQNRGNDHSTIDGPNDNDIVVTFDDDVALVSTDEAAFGATIEFNEQPLTNLVAGNSILLELDLPSATANFLHMQPGVMNLVLNANGVRWPDSGEGNGTQTFRATRNDGPLLVAAYWRQDGDTVLLPVFDQAVTGPDLPGASFSSKFDDSTGLLEGSVSTWFPTSWTNVLRVEVTVDTAGIPTWIGIEDGAVDPLQDYQDLPALSGVSVNFARVHQGIGLVRAAYNDNLTPTDYTDDELWLYFSEPFDPADEDNLAVDGSNFLDYFQLEGFDLGDEPSVEYTPPPAPDQFARVLVKDWYRETDPLPYKQGCRIIPIENLAAPINGEISGGPLYSEIPGDPPVPAVHWIPVLDESRPSQLVIEDTHQILGDAWAYDIADDFYTLFLRFAETAANGAGPTEEDSDQYFLYVIQSSDEDDWDLTDMDTWLDSATPIGNINARQIDESTRLAIPVSTTNEADHLGGYPPGTLFETVEGVDITTPAGLSFLLAAADWQGNLSRIEVINPDELGWEFLSPQPFNPDLRVYIQPEYCTSPPADSGMVRLYGIHYIHDYEVDRVRFEWLKDDNDDLTDDEDDWEEIITVGGIADSAGRGDPLMYWNNSDQGCRDDLATLVNPVFPNADDPWELGDGTQYKYYDADNDGIYSARDAVVHDLNDDGFFNDFTDPVIIGSDGYIENIPDGSILTEFTNYTNDSDTEPAYYWAEAAMQCDGTPSDGVLDPSDYIFRENREGYLDDIATGLPVELRGVNLWMADWDPCNNPDHGDGTPIDGGYITRCIAIDRANNEDVIDQHEYIPEEWNPLEIEWVDISCEGDVAIELTTVEAYVPFWNDATDAWEWDVTVLDVNQDPPTVEEVPHGTRFLKFTAETAVTDIVDVRFLFNLLGTDYVIGPNPDGDSYADLDAIRGYQYQGGFAPYLDDERILDDGDGIFQAANDTVVDMGRNGAVDTPEGQLLIPLVREDIGADNDNDGNTDDDDNPDNQADLFEPYVAFFDLAESGFVFGLDTGTISVTVTRDVVACPSGTLSGADTELLEFNNWTYPVVDVIRVEDEDDDVVDVWHPVSDGDPYAILGPDDTPATPRTFQVHVTAEDADGIEWVDLWYRVNPACGGTPTVWMPLTAGDMDLSLPPWDEYPDETYPYSFHWLLGTLDDVNEHYQFYARAMDTVGNFSWIPVYPYGFGFNEYAGEELAQIVPLANTDRCEDGPLVAVGEEYLLTAELTDPALVDAVQVRFYFAPRIQGEEYVTEDINVVTNELDLAEMILDPTNGGLVVCVDGVEYSEANYTAFAGDTFITFTTLPAAEAEIVVNYNFRNGTSPVEGWLPIGVGDDVSPYTVEWEEGMDPPGVPPTDDPAGDGSVDWSEANAYDLIAVALIDVDGDGVYDPGSLCDMMEPLHSENGNHIILEVVQRPIVHLWGLDYEPDFATGGFHYPQQEFWPGNPFGVSQAGNVEHKLSGKEAQVWVTASAFSPAVVDSVLLQLFKEFHSEAYFTERMNFAPDGTEWTMPVTMYTEDYYEVRPAEIENVELRMNNVTDGELVSYTMTEDADGHYVANPMVTTGKTYSYTFFVDLIGDDFGEFADRRNMSPIEVEVPAIPTGYESWIVTPPGDFYYLHLTADDFEEDTIYRAKAWAFDSEGRIGTTMGDGSGDPQGPLPFVYDTTSPNIDRFWADPEIIPGAMLPFTTIVRFEGADIPNDDVNVITTRTGVFQYSATETPDDWITFGIDRDYSDGWSADMTFGPANILPPDQDFYDNDGDGEVDEDDEVVTSYPVRVVVFDDAGYGGDPMAPLFPGSGNPTYSAETIVYFDGMAPFTHIIDPHDGTVFPFGSVIDVTGLANDTAPEAIVNPGVQYVRFQYKDGRTLWIDAGGSGYYDHGIDFVFADNGDGDWNAADDTALFGTPPADGTAGDPWFDIDPTINDNTDTPLIWATDPNQEEFMVAFDTRQVWSTEDTYVRLRMLAYDNAGNWTIEDPFHAEEIIIILDDSTAPVAFLQWLTASCDPACRNLAAGEEEGVKGVIGLHGSVMDPTNFDLSRVVAVDIEISTDGENWEVLGRDDAPFTSDPDAAGCLEVPPTGPNLAFFEWAWDTDMWAEGLYWVRAVAIDNDGNSDPAGALYVLIRVDRTPPVVYYAGEGFPGFVESVETYYDDGTPDQTSLVIRRDDDTGDVEFRVYTMDNDISGMTLQWRYPTDPLGLWRPWSEAFYETNDAGRLIFQDFTYEPAQNFGDNFVWVAHAEDFFYETAPGAQDFLVMSTFVEGPIEWRVLATDGACNTNSGQAETVAAAVDLTAPTVWDFNVDKPTLQVVPGEDMTFTVLLKDATTDTRHVTLWAVEDEGTPSEVRWVAGDGELMPVAEGDNVFDLDGPNTQWKFVSTWAYPNTVYKDTPLKMHVVRTDPAGNVDGMMAESFLPTITVEDLVPPDNTKIVLIANEVTFSDDKADGWDIDPADLNRLQDNDNLWVNRDGVPGFDEFGGDPLNNDFLISEGAAHGVEPIEPPASDYYLLGDDMATYPRWVDESYLGNSGANPPRIARTLTLVARTWVDDQSFGTADDGVAKVTFLVRPVGGDYVTLTADEYQPFYPLYLWHGIWNTLELASDGVTPMWPDGMYEVAAWGLDLSGNPEDINNLEWALVEVDNTPVVAVMDADPATETVETDAGEIERNTFFTLYARTSPESPLNDDAVTFYVKRTRDLNMAASYAMVDPTWGVTPEDGNPDDTRPYSFDLALGMAYDPVEWNHWLNDPSNAPMPGPLHVGEEYDFAAAGSDLLNNTYSHIAAYDDGAWVKMKVVDTIAPTMTIIAAKRNIGDTRTIFNPLDVSAQSFEYLQARNLDGHVDLDDVFYVYRETGTGPGNWTLLDGTLDELEGNVWQIGPWDLRALKHNTWYEVAAIGVDDVGNMSDADGEATPKMNVYVDFEAPTGYAVTHPVEGATHLCDWYDAGTSNKYYDLEVTFQGDAEFEEITDVKFYYKLHRTIADDLEDWTYISSFEVVHDDATNTYRQKWDIDSLSSDVYDLAAEITDAAGNKTILTVTRLAVDNDDPDNVQISNIEAITEGAPDIEFHPSGLTDLATGIEVRIWATAEDEEINIPADRATAVAEMQFYAQDYTNDDDWFLLGTTVPAQDLGDPSDWTGYVDWNTTGLPIGHEFYVGVVVIDECGNMLGRDFNPSVYYQFRITDIVPPTARIVCFDPDLQIHGEDPPTHVDIYALAESDDCITDVMFQYDTIEGPEDTDHEWVNIGISEELCVDGSSDYTTEVLWRAAIETSAFPEGYDHFWLRALVMDCDGNRYGDDPTDVVPTMEVTLETLFDGTITFVPVRTAEMVVEDVSVQIESVTRSQPQAILTVKMADAAERPRVVVLGESNYIDGEPNDYWWIYTAGLPSDPENNSFGLVRSLDDPTVWRGKISLTEHYCGEGDIDECLNFQVCATGLAEGWFIDHAGLAIHEYPVSRELGTNGTVTTPGYADTESGLMNEVEIASGSWMGDDACLLVSETVAPQLDMDQARFLYAVDHTAYHMELTKTERVDDFAPGYLPVVTISYSQADLDAVLGEGMTEEMLTVRRWIPVWAHGDDDGGYWTGDGISWIQVDPAANTISFRVDNLTNAFDCEDGDPEDCAKGNIFQVFAPKATAPVFVYSFTPQSEYRSEWWTDADPIVAAYLNDGTGQGIDVSSIVVEIDDNPVATWFNQDYPDAHINATWVFGNGSASVDAVNADGPNGTSTIYELNYNHSTVQRDWLTEGHHVLSICFEPLNGSAEMTCVDTDFYVDLTPPIVEFHGGWISNPLLSNIYGYIPGEDEMLTVRMKDEGSGVHVRSLRDDDDEWGIKYDLWLVQYDEDDQLDIDEYEERMLLHPGTETEILPYIQRMRGDEILDGLEGYEPATDELLVRLPVVGGGIIKDRDILEVAIYTYKYIETDGPGFGCDEIEVVIDGEPYTLLGNCFFDLLSQELHVYDDGVSDEAQNWGAYLEQRFIVDMLPPVCTFNLPGATVDPSGDLLIDVTVMDSGVGLDNGSASIVVIGPDGEELEIEDLRVAGDRITGKVTGPLERGDYTITVTGADRLGHACSTSKTIRAEAKLLTLTEVYGYPNPFHPEDGDMTINFDLSKTSDVTAKVYDFAGEYVTTITNGKMAPGETITWGGTASDGTKVANGAYILRVVATDGARTETANLKVVIWRE